MPSNLPPVGWLSIWLPVITGARLSSLPGRRAKILPILSILMLQPAWRHQSMKRSRAWRSRSVKARRQTPPLAVAPILAISIRLSHSRSPSTLRLVATCHSCFFLFRRFLSVRIPRVLSPVQIGFAGIDLDHGDAVRNRADMLAEVAADAFLIDHLVAPLAVHPFRRDGLVRGVLAGDVAEAALDALVLVDRGDGLVVDVEILPVGHVRHRPAAEILDRPVALGIHPVAEPGDHVIDDAEAVMHGCGADLHRAGGERNEFRG